MTSYDGPPPAYNDTEAVPYPPNPGAAQHSSPSDPPYPPPPNPAYPPAPANYAKPPPGGYDGFQQQQGYYGQQQMAYPSAQTSYGQPVYTAGYSNNTVVITGQPAGGHHVIVQQNRSFKPPSYLGLAIFTTVCCNFVFGIIAIIFSVMSDSAHGDGEVESARTKGKVSLGLSIAGIIVTVICVAVAVASVFGWGWHSYYYWG